MRPKCYVNVIKIILLATPPNAIVFGSREIAIGDMMRAGLWVGVMSITSITPLLRLAFGD